MQLMTNEDLLHLLQKLYPGTDNGKDYMTGHRLTADRVQDGHGFIFSWNMDKPEPKQKDLEALWEKHGMDILTAREIRELRYQRNQKLLAADGMYHIAVDRDDAEMIKLVRVYRQALRDIPQQPGFPDTIDWPTAPDA